MGLPRDETALTNVLHMPLARLAQQTAARIGFTVRRWWRDAQDQGVLHVEVERRLIGAPPAVAELRVPIPRLPTSPRRATKSPASSTHKRPGSPPTRKRQVGRARKT